MQQKKQQLKPHFLKRHSFSSPKNVNHLHSIIALFLTVSHQNKAFWKASFPIFWASKVELNSFMTSSVSIQLDLINGEKTVGHQKKAFWKASFPMFWASKVGLNSFMTQSVSIQLDLNNDEKIQVSICFQKISTNVKQDSFHGNFFIT